MRLSALALAILLFPSVLSAEERYYRSNEVAMPIEQIAWYRAKDYVYVLRVETDGEAETRVLLREGAEIERLRVQRLAEGRRRETRFVERETASVEDYDATGRMIRREVFEDGERVSIETMTYREGRLSIREIRTSEGELVSTDRYTYDSEGLLRAVVRELAGGGGRNSEYTFQNGMLLQEWHGQDGVGMLIRYGVAGRETARETWDGDSLVTRETFEYTAAGVLARSVATSFAEESETVMLYDTAGRPSRAETTLSGEIVSTVTYEYEDDRISTRREESAAGVLEWRYAYREDGEIAEESFHTDGVITKRILYPEANHVIEERFRDGEVFIRIFLESGRRTREEVIRSGRVVQERTYE